MHSHAWFYGVRLNSQLLTRLLIAVLCLAAFVLILFIASGPSLGEESWNVLFAAVALAFFSLTGVAGMSLVGRRSELWWFGYLTAIVSAGAFVVTVMAIWADDGWKLAGCVAVLALANGHTSLLLASQREDDSDAVRLLRGGVLGTLSLLCLMVVVELSSRGENVGIRAIAVVAVLYLLGAILLPLMRRASAAAGTGVD